MRGKGANTCESKHKVRSENPVSEVRPKVIGTLVSANQAGERVETLRVHMLRALA
jgi:hypothetical protein